jgi:tetratricopeptide (TPR) repeat protein
MAPAGARGGDPDVADLLLKKAKKAFAAKSYEEAETGFRRALEEMTPLPEARLGLAEALEKLNRPREALDTYRACVAEIENEGDPAKWKAMKSRAQQALSRLQKRHAELSRLNEAFIRKCIDFGKKRAASDPLWARKAFEAVLLLDPGNEVAEGLLRKLPDAGAAPAPAPKKPSTKEGTLFRRDIWDGAPEWSVESDTITGDVREPDGRLLWLDTISFEGKYTFRGRLRLTRDGGVRRAYGIFFGGDGKTRWWTVVFSDNEEIVMERFEDGPPTRIDGSFLDEFDHMKWHTLEVAVEPGSARVTLDDREVFHHDKDDRGAFDGKICLFVQNACVEWKDLEVVR